MVILKVKLALCSFIEAHGNDSITNVYDRNQYHPAYNGTSSSNFIAGRPKAALLFWFFGDFRCGVLLFLQHI